MIIVYPVSHDKVEYIDKTSQLLKELGSNGQHELLVVATPSILQDAQTFVELVKELFASAAVHCASEEYSLLDPFGRGQMFREAARAVIQKGKPWIWMEDCVPTRPGWIEELDMEYLRFSHPCLGVIEPTYFRAGTDEAGEPLFRPHHEHFRCGIYSHMIGQSDLLGFLDPNQPFEYELQFDIVPRAQRTELIKSIWASANFRLTNEGMIVGDQTTESEIRKVIPVPFATTALIHGCKDDSMTDIVLDSLRPKEVEPERVSEEPEAVEPDPEPEPTPKKAPAKKKIAAKKKTPAKKKTSSRRKAAATK